MSNLNELASTRTVAETVELVKGTPSSIFTKDDVLNLLSAIRSENGLSKDMLDEMLDSIENRLQMVGYEDVFDRTSAEFSLCGNTIELDSVEVDTASIYYEVEGAVNNWYKSNFQ